MRPKPCVDCKYSGCVNRSEVDECIKCCSSGPFRRWLDGHDEPFNSYPSPES
jgi:hypothetical protein